MRYFSAWSQRTKERLGASSLMDSRSFLVNSQTTPMRPMFRASLPERISAYLRHRLLLDAGFILLLGAIIGAVFVSTRLT